MKKAITPDTAPAPSEQVSWKRCRHCHQLFKPAKAYFICCSWECQQAYKEAQAALEELDKQTYKGHPF